MKTKIKVLIIFLIGITSISTFKVYADEYNTLNLVDTLKEEEIELKYSKYKETDKQITIYMFRGKGCGYCKAFLNFMNDIAEEYGKYFKLVTYEVWYDENNASLMTNVSNFLNKPASGVPYIIIGETVFSGYAKDYDENIKKAIMELYETDESDRYDVFEEIEKENNKSEKENTNIIVWNLLFITTATIIITANINSKFKKLEQSIETISKGNNTNDKNKEVEE